MAERKNTKSEQKIKEDYLNEKVTFVIRRPEGIDEDFTTVTVNGKNYQIAYGKTVLIPRFVCEVIKNGYDAAESAGAKQREFAGLFNKKAGELL